MNKIDVYERKLQDLEEDIFLRYFSDCWNHHSCSECNNNQLCLQFTHDYNKFVSTVRLLEMQFFGDEND